LEDLLRSAVARTIPAHLDAIQRSLICFAPAEYRAYFGAVEYNATCSDGALNVCQRIGTFALTCTSSPSLRELSMSTSTESDG
jgi:hypothetical protein